MRKTNRKQMSPVVAEAFRRATAANQAVADAERALDSARGDDIEQARAVYTAAYEDWGVLVGIWREAQLAEPVQS